MDVKKITVEAVGYPWGSPTVLQNMLGREIPGVPLIGELWMGVHDNAPSRLISNPGTLLEDFLRQNPHYLGKAPSFPFLLKAMAFRQPLALQVHPNTEQARLGYAKETVKRTQVEKSLLSYQDPNEKAEMLVALGPCTVMCGFLSPQQIEKNFQTLLPKRYMDLFQGCATHRDPIKAYLERLYALSREALQDFNAELVSNLSTVSEKHVPGFLTAKEIALQAASLYPGDVGLIFPFMMQILHLKKRDSIYLQPGVMHAYISGCGIELMTNSDNILRGGLTSKYCDTDELLRLVSTTYEDIELVPKRQTGTMIRYQTDTEEFVLDQYLSGSCEREGGNLSLLFCTEGYATLSSEGESIRFDQGECLLVGSSLPLSELEVSGEVFSASYPKK